MTDFQNKHEELYLEELESITGALTADTEIKKLILKINLTKDNVIKILKILYQNLTSERLENILSIGVEDHGSITLRQKTYQLFEIEFINFLLNRLETKNILLITEQNNE